MININKFEKDINFKFKNKALIISALTHKSSNQKANNEKLEFLGDRVIGLALSKKLYDLYPDENEGILDKRFATLVNRKTCCNVAWSLNVQNHIIIGNLKKKVTKRDEKILSDCCEAIIGAIYIDRDFETVKNYILKAWKKFIDKTIVTILDPKTKLQEFSLKKYKKLPLYRVVNSSGPKHNPIYKISVSIIGSKEYIGTGSSKQIAQLDGAAKLIKGKNIK
jgi:ribonuclease-3